MQLAWRRAKNGGKSAHLTKPLSSFFARPIFRAALELTGRLQETRKYAVNIKKDSLISVPRPLKQGTNNGPIDQPIDEESKQTN